MDDGGKQVSWLVAEVHRVTFPDRQLLQVQWSRRAAHHLQLRGQPGHLTRFPFNPMQWELDAATRMLADAARVNLRKNYGSHARN